MALDHIIRAKATNSGMTNMEKATNHILRGLLDILKLNCAELKTTIQKEHDGYPRKVWGLVADGEYIKNFIELQNTAENSICEAKCNDYRLDENSCWDVDVVNKFIYALEAHDEWRQYQREYRGRVFVGYTWYHIIRGSSLLLAIIAGFVANYLWSYKAELLDFILKTLRRLMDVAMTIVS